MLEWKCRSEGYKWFILLHVAKPDSWMELSVCIFCMSLTSGCRFIQSGWGFIVYGGDEGGRKWKRELRIWGIFLLWGTVKCQGQISPHFVWFLVNTHLRKAFSKCLVFCDILESPIPQPAFAEDRTNLWPSSCTGSHWPRGWIISDPHMHSLYLPNFGEVGFLGRAFR